ncbi:hypothetical protein [Aquabacter cavernae]|uniref:hypothetical protein n=1 Tax=Aquabacter cavernae TaxID=2496029 RepID=UPI000F8C7FA8|nr:hypothetical protein [Aquabacter cavernae]
MAQTMSQRGEAAGQMNSALDQWDEEGGAPAMPWPLRPDMDHLSDMERRILESLGAALVGEWGSLQTDIQRAIFHRLASDTAHGGDELKAQVARFLHDHKSVYPAP